MENKASKLVGFRLEVESEIKFLKGKGIAKEQFMKQAIQAFKEGKFEYNYMF